VALLGAADTVTRVDVDLPEIARPVEEVLAWAVREGATNTLRHSRATSWTVTARSEGRDDGDRLVLEIVNDGAPAVPAAAVGPRDGDTGTGLAGLAERARAVAGTASAERTPDGRFRLLVEIPREVS
jgi:two-component system, NarL family, sensor histidine kinase DesK